ncbi:hypothetical protein LOTGIDRAFT_236927 [Lottia gigantea]|uniref:Uncharacterized protein n=1 Tax=Lottia gigantea TaxID=225164 RepID=V3ZJI8_LOTGI|nr:hypothetical protein LOTGIDRAFT_236927 [Lottia gigantea]ESO82535.1 hypothetical protein LOTGIDRAFT_236927 [Lottia gigantea]
MMTQNSPEPHPLTRLNVTQHDKIWEREQPRNFFGFNTNDIAFSPPLKHITPDTAKELWENFDPLDALDSGSESSCDTMIMMNTEEEQRNELSIQRSNQSYEQRKQIERNYKYGPHILPTLEEDDTAIDEGYGTDNRTNTSASFSSPLSSSLSSLSTSESTSSNGSLPRQQTTQMSKTPQITSNGRVTVNNRPIMPVRKVTQNVDRQENSQSLEERLRALTTIEEEDSNQSDQEKPSRPQNLRGSFQKRDFRRSGGQSANRSGPIQYNGTVSQKDKEGVFRAVPVQVGQGQDQKLPNEYHGSSGNMPTSPTSRQEWINRVEKMGYVPHSDVKYYDTLWNDKNIQMGMSDKCNDTKRIPVLNDDVESDMIMKPKQSHMVSMPDLRFDRQQHPPVIYSNDTPVKMRQKTPARRDRYSWDCNNSSHPELTNQIANIESCDSPRLQDQLRAMSELSLGIKKPLYASSADIYKLFQGQGQNQYGLPQGRNSSHRHSFHTVPSSQSWMQTIPQSTEEVKMRLRSGSGSSKRPPQKPMRVSYDQSYGPSSSVRDMPSFVPDGRNENNMGLGLPYFLQMPLLTYSVHFDTIKQIYFFLSGRIKSQAH